MIRDNEVIHEKVLKECLPGSGMTPRDWYNDFMSMFFAPFQRVTPRKPYARASP